MRILFLTANAFIPEHFSEPNRTLLELCRRLVELDHEPIILAGKNPSQETSDVVSDRGYGFRIFRATNLFMSIPAICATLNPDINVVIDVHYMELIEQCQSLDFPLAVWLFHVEPHYFRNNSLADNLLYLTNSSFLAKRTKALFGVEAKVIAPYIQKTDSPQAHQGNRILFVNPVREKGVEIAFRLAQQRPNIAFSFMESWGISEQWRAICFDRALHCGNIEWIPATTNISSVLDNTRLLLIPRIIEEGFCRLVTEAQQCGIPVLASDRGYLWNNVGPGGTVLKIDTDITAWLGAIDRYFEDDKYYNQISQQALNHVCRDEVDGSHIIDRILLLLASQISKHQQNRLAFPKN